MQHRSRSDQTGSGDLVWTFGVLKPPALSDSLFDTSDLPRPMRAVNWLMESQVHRAVQVTDKLRNSNQFVGVQTMIVRDEVRQQTHLIAIETDGLFHYMLKDCRVVSSAKVSGSTVKRAHLRLRKFDGSPVIAYVTETESGSSLFVNDEEVPTSSSDLDFPYLAIDQPPIGFPATKPPEQALLCYKCRASNRIFSRRIDPVSLRVEDEVELPFDGSVGGADTEFAKSKLVVRAQIVDDGHLLTHTTTSTDLGKSFSPAAKLDISTVPHDEEVPSNAPITIDNTSDTHIPMAVANSSKTLLLDVLPDDNLIIGAIESSPSANSAVVAFPSMSGFHAGLRQGFGDGLLDGNGMIATAGSQGRLLVANSQSGGYSYPEPAHLNHDMQSVFGFRSTECYTRGVDPNMVSMDYAFVESDDDGHPVSSELWVDTWDMPLPEPDVSYSMDGDKVRLSIHRSAWFFPGQTAFQIDPANTFITRAEFNGYREVVLEFNDPTQVRGATITFETRNVFYFHRGSVHIR